VSSFVEKSEIWDTKENVFHHLGLGLLGRPVFHDPDATCCDMVGWHEATWTIGGRWVGQLLPLSLQEWTPKPPSPMWSYIYQSGLGPYTVTVFLIVFLLDPP